MIDVGQVVADVRNAKTGEEFFGDERVSEKIVGAIQVAHGGGDAWAQGGGFPVLFPVGKDLGGVGGVVAAGGEESAAAEGGHDGAHAGVVGGEQPREVAAPTDADHADAGGIDSGGAGEPVEADGGGLEGDGQKCGAEGRGG